MEQSKREDLIILAKTTLNCLREIKKHCTKEMYKTLCELVITKTTVILMILEKGDSI